MNFFGELKRRSVFRMGVFYLLGSWVALQVADVLVGVVGLPDWSMRLVGLLLLLGLPLVLVLSWVYELTPEGLKKDDSVDETGHEVVVTPFQRIVLVLSFAVVMAGGYVLIDRFLVEQQQTEDQATVPSSTPRIEPVTIAMLPIEPGPAPIYMRNGEQHSLTGQLTGLVRGFKDIRVLPTQRITPPEGSEQTARDLAEEQFATHWLIGRTRSREDSIWLNVEIVDARTRERFWAYSLEEPVIEAGELNDAGLGQIWFQMGTALATHGLTEMAADTDNPLAFEAWWRGRNEGFSHLQQGQRSDQRLAWYEEAVMLDPDFVDAHNEIAKFWFTRTHQGTPWADVREPSMAAATRALEIDPDDPEANANMSRILLLERTLSRDPEEWDRLEKESMDLARKAVQLAPRNASIREDYIRALWTQQDWNEVVTQIQIILRYKPDEAQYLDEWMTSPLVWAGRMDEAEAHVEKMRTKYPDRDFTHFEGAFTINRAKGEHLAALEALHPMMVIEPTVWVQDYMDLLSDMGALEAVDRWGRHLGEVGEGDLLNFVWGYVLSSNKHLGRLESALALTNELSDSVLSAREKNLQRQDIAYIRALKSAIDEPETNALLSQLDAFCEQFEQSQLVPVNYQLTADIVTVSSKCHVLSARTESDRSAMGEAVLRFYEESHSFTPGPPGSLRTVDFGKMQLIYTLARMGRLDDALTTFQELYHQGFSRPHHFGTYGVIPDLEGIYGGLSSHREFQEMIDQIEARNSALRAEIEENAPWLFDPDLSSPYLDSLKNAAVVSEP